MRPIAPRTAILLVVIVSLPTQADEDLDVFLPAIQPASATFRFSDEEPPWEMNGAVSASLAGKFGQSASGCDGTCRESCSHRFLGVIAPSDKRFCCFISPISNPVYFENPRTLSEVRFVYLHQKVPLAAGGGEVDLLTLQLRAALTNRFSMIATKSGFFTSSSPLVDDGWADVNAGFKYTVLSDPALQRLLSVGLTYELPAGSTRTRQGNGDGLFHLFLTGGAARDHWQVISAAGLLLPADRSAESSLGYWSNHLSRRIGFTDLHVLGEVNWFHWLGAGDAFPLPLEGIDTFNFGARGVAGNDIVTGAFGLKYKPSDRLELGCAWEAPLTGRRDVLDNRLTVDCILRY